MSPDQTTIVRLASPDELATTVATRLLTTLAEAQREERVPAIVLTGGTVAAKVHAEVARLGPASAVDWARVDFWWGDDRYVARDDPDRNALQAFQAMLDRLPVDAARTHQMPHDDGTPIAQAALRYDAEVRTYAPPLFDVVMLGMGPDGHVASLFPGYPQLDVRGRSAVPVTGAPKPPPDRISLTFEVLDRAREAWFLVTGEAKATATAAAIHGADPHDIPAAGITAPRVWFLDQAAAAGL